MNYLLNNEPASFKSLYRTALSLGYVGARGPFWVCTYLSAKDYTVYEMVKGTKREVGRK